MQFPVGRPVAADERERNVGGRRITSATDIGFLRQAISVARLARERGSDPFGTILAAYGVLAH